MTKAYIFFSVHEELFHRMALELRAYGIDQFCGFIWGKQQERALAGRGIDYDPLVMFSRDFLLHRNNGAPPDLDWLERRERELGVSISRMLTAERHLLTGLSFEQVMRLAEVGLRETEAAFERAKPDFVFSEDISCFHSYAHFVIARERGIPFWCIGSARLPYRTAIYSAGLQKWESVEALYKKYRAEGVGAEERRVAATYVSDFRDRPRRPTGMDTRARHPGVGTAEANLFSHAFRQYFLDPKNPTTTPPHRLIYQRLRRIARVKAADALGTFEQPVAGERYVIYPIHFQPEASTLVQGPMYLDQVALIEDIAKSLPVGVRLYVKEHLSNRGRRPLEFYNAIRSIPAVRLLGPDVDTWELIRNAAAIAVITGTMGWEGLLFGKPVITFGDVFYNAVPDVYRASEVPKDGWYNLFRRALSEHRPDEEALIAFIAAMHGGSYPGFIRNPVSFPEVLKPDNVTALVTALASAAGLARSTSFAHRAV
jgi:hypothetical protein